MSAFVTAHATHPDWRMALALAAAQLDAGRAARPGADWTLGLVYFTDAYAPHAQALLAELRQRWPGLHWAGCVGVGVAASGVEYVDEPALVLMACDLPRSQFEVFSGARRLAGAPPAAALVHADASTPDIAELIAELSARTTSGYLFGGLAASRSATVTVADGIWQGGLSGVAFAPGVALVSGRARIQAASEKGVMDSVLSYLAVWRLEDGKWRFLAWQSCKLPPANP